MKQQLPHTPAKGEGAFRFDRLEVAGSLGDLGTLLPLAIGLIVLNGLSATNVFVMAGLFYIVAGTVFRVPIAVQPMKAIATYAIGVGLQPIEITSAGLWMGGILLFLGVTGLIAWIGRLTPKSVIRGLQLGLGILLMTKGIGCIINPDGNLAVHTIGPVPTGLLIGLVGLGLAVVLLNNKKVPAAVAIVGLGITSGMLFGTPIDASGFNPGIYLPTPLPYGMPTWQTLIHVIPLVVLPQVPLTIGNAIISNTNLTTQYFPNIGNRMTNQRSAISQGLANVASFLFGGMPMCHGAGGLAAHYRFGARTAGSNLIIGGLFLVLSLTLGETLVAVFRIIPMAILGVLLTLAGLQLSVMIEDIRERGELVVVIAMLGITLTLNLAVAFAAGFVIAYVLKHRRARA
ncbi:MAG: putative sulfate/molybdate transporter [Myxococcota bacterium]|nr:putative sulfate/molybdate transporter [Myxococcota bacterium]